MTPEYTHKSFFHISGPVVFDKVLASVVWAAASMWLLSDVATVCLTKKGNTDIDDFA